MQAIIMAAGKGTRLGSLTEEIPKAFLEVRGYKMIEYNIALLHSFGIRDIIIVTGYRCDMFERLAEKIEGVRCILNPFFDKTNVLGSFYMGQELLAGDFVYLHADTLCDPAIFKEMMETNADMVLPVDFVACDEEAMKVRSEHGIVTEINKTMNCQEAEGEFIGIAKVSAVILPDLKHTAKELMQEKAFSSYFEAAIQRLADMRKYNIQTISTKGLFWGEVDFLEDYQRVEKGISKELIELAKKEF